VASGKAGAKKEARKLKARKAPGGFKPDVAAGLNRNATTSACVGWDKTQYRKSGHVSQASLTPDSLQD
jgi:hypothetical protein